MWHISEQQCDALLLAAEPDPLLGRLVLIDNLQTRPELNGQLGLVSTFNSERGRYAVSILEGAAPTFILLKASNISGWKDQDVSVMQQADLAFRQGASTATPAQLLKLLRKGLSLTETGAVACCERIVKLLGKPEERELLNGGAIEMVVQSIEHHLGAARWALYRCLETLASMVLGADDRPELLTGSDPPSEARKARAASAGVFPLLAHVLATHPRADIQAMALGALQSILSGGRLEPEARRVAACRADCMEATIGALDLYQQSSLVAHNGMCCMAALCGGDDNAPGPEARRQRAFGLDDHTLIIQLMRRYAGNVGLHEMPLQGELTDQARMAMGFPAMQRQTGGAVVPAMVMIPDTMLHAGCLALSTLCWEGPEGRRGVAMLEAGASDVLLLAARAVPQAGVNLSGAIKCVVDGMRNAGLETIMTEDVGLEKMRSILGRNPHTVDAGAGAA